MRYNTTIHITDNFIILLFFAFALFFQLRLKT